MRIILCLLLCAGFGAAQCQIENELERHVIAENLYVPWDMAWGLDNHIWVLQKDGQLTRINPDTKEKEDIYKISDVFQSNDNSGAHSLALHPKFPLVPWIYCNYTYSEFRGRLIRIQLPLNKQSGSTIVETLMDTIPGNSSHNGSRLVFGPDDYLYFCTGDAYMSEWAQRTDTRAGKILRMDENGQAAPENPFGEYMFTIGHRNPQGLVFADDGKLYSAEHGTSTDDELNLIEAGGNYGWPIVSGFCDTPSEIANCEGQGFIDPLVTWTPTEAPCAIAYFNHASIPAWEHSIIACFLKGQCLRVMSLNEEGTEVVDTRTVYHEEMGRFREVLVAPNGRVFITTSNREVNGWDFLAATHDDQIIELVNPDYEYPALPSFMEGFAFGDSYRLFPNPLGVYLNIVFDHTTDFLDYQIADLDGRIVRSNRIEPIVEGFCQIHLPELAPGPYTIRLISEGLPDNVQTIIKGGS